MLSTLRFRLYPNRAQTKQLAIQFGHARWVYNNALNYKQTIYQNDGKNLNYIDLANRLPLLKEENVWLKDADSQVLQQTLKNLLKAYENFFAKRAEFPSVKRKKSRQSIQYPQRVRVGKNPEIANSASCTYLPKVGWIKTIFHRNLLSSETDKIKTVTIVKEPCNHYYACFVVEKEGSHPDPSIEEGCKLTGGDLGCTNVITMEDGYKKPNPRHLKRAEKKLAKAQRKHAKTKKSKNSSEKGSKNREKVRLKVARLHERVKNTRKDFLDKLSSYLVANNHGIAMEDLNIKAMIKSLNLSKSISDLGWGILINMLRYKCMRAGKYFIQVDRYFPSSKLCSECGYKNKSLTLKTRVWTCPECNSLHDRDTNAAKNIGLEGNRILRSMLGIDCELQSSIEHTECSSLDCTLQSRVSGIGILEGCEISPLSGDSFGLDRARVLSDIDGSMKLEARDFSHG